MGYQYLLPWSVADQRNHELAECGKIRQHRRQTSGETVTAANGRDMNHDQGQLRGT